MHGMCIDDREVGIRSLGLNNPPPGDPWGSPRTHVYHHHLSLFLPPRHFIPQGSQAAAFRYGTFTKSRIIVGRQAVVSGLCVLAGPGASVAERAVLPPNSSSTDPDALRRGQAMQPDSLRLAAAPVGMLPALASLLCVIIFESAMLIPATSECLVVFATRVL